MRGKQRIYKNFLKQETSEQRKRNHFLPERNKALVSRYYYYIIIQANNYEDALVALEREFFISETTIAKEIGKPNEYALLQRLIEQEFSIKQLAAMYPHFVWRYQKQLAIRF